MAPAMLIWFCGASSLFCPPGGDGTRGAAWVGFAFLPTFFPGCSFTLIKCFLMSFNYFGISELIERRKLGAQG